MAPSFGPGAYDEYGQPIAYAAPPAYGQPAYGLPAVVMQQGPPQAPYASPNPNEGKGYYPNV